VCGVEGKVAIPPISGKLHVARLEKIVMIGNTAHQHQKGGCVNLGVASIDRVLRNVDVQINAQQPVGEIFLKQSIADVVEWRSEECTRL
jgi:hypothetical protein